MKKLKIIAIILCLATVIGLCIACSGDKKDDGKNDDKNAYQFPEDGILTPLENGKAPFAPDGKNPSFVGNKLLVFFDFYNENAGLDLADNTEISYKVKGSDGKVKEGKTKLDTTVKSIKNDYGYVGVCFDPGMTFDIYKSASFSISFNDKSGKTFYVNDQKIIKGISYYGVEQKDYDKYLGEFVKTTITTNTIKQEGTINGNKYYFNIDLSDWSRETKANQIVMISRLFWQVYPAMYERFGADVNSPKIINMTIDSKSDTLASVAGGNKMHLRNDWLGNNPTDYDCLTHELGHVIQNSWNRSYCEFNECVELFAEYSRYVYAFDDGAINDDHWSLPTVSSESTRKTSKRFFVWLDYTYSTKEVDIIKRYVTFACNDVYKTADWETKAWPEILKGTELEGKTIDEVWEMYKNSQFAILSTKATSTGTSPLLQKYSDVRTKLKTLHVQ